MYISNLIGRGDLFYSSSVNIITNHDMGWSMEYRGNALPHSELEMNSVPVGLPGRPR